MNTNDFLSFAKDVERENVKVNISQEGISYLFRMLCRLETQHFVVFRVSGNNHDYDFNPKKPLTFSVGDDQIEIGPGGFIFDRYYIIVKYSTVKVTADDTTIDTSDGRKNTRFKIQKELKAKVELSSLRINEKVIGILIDLSQSGCAVLLQEKHAYPLQPGDIININRIANEGTEMLEAVVVHKRLVDEQNKHYQLATKFTEPLKMTKVLSLVKSCKVGVLDD